MVLNKNNIQVLSLQLSTVMQSVDTFASLTGQSLVPQNLFC